MKALLVFFIFLSLCSFASVQRNESNSNVEYYYCDSPELKVDTVKKRDQKAILPANAKAASFIGGDSALFNFLGKNLVYPDSAINYHLSGKTIVEFWINVDGSIEDVHVVKSSGISILDNEAIRVVLLTNKHWIPAKIDDVEVKSIGRMPIYFDSIDE